MSTPPGPDLGRKVSQLDNDVGAIHNMLGTIQATQERHGNQDVAGLRIGVAAILEHLRSGREEQR